MALMNCPECQKEVSNSALKCPHCGKQLQKLKRSLVGKIIKGIFWLFNILMCVWMVGGMNSASKVVETAGSNAGEAGAMVGAGIGAMMILFIWGLGDAILGIMVLVTRPK